MSVEQSGRHFILLLDKYGLDEEALHYWHTLPPSQRTQYDVKFIHFICVLSVQVPFYNKYYIKTLTK